MKRAFIVGNGPSLADAPLDMMAGEVSFAVNRIHLMFNKTIWRPTHYVRAENPYCTKEVLMNDLRQIFSIGGVTNYLNRGFEGPWRALRKFEHPTNVIEFMPESCCHTLLHYDDPDVPREWHDPLCMFGSSLHVAIQLAAKLGYGPLYLVGCDLGYKQDQPSHFDPNYETGYEDKLKPADYANGDCYWAHNIAFRCCPVPIFNATVGGDLDVYPRVDFESLFRKEEDHAETSRGLQPGQGEPRGSQVGDHAGDKKASGKRRGRR